MIFYFFFVHHLFKSSFVFGFKIKRKVISISLSLLFSLFYYFHILVFLFYQVQFHISMVFLFKEEIRILLQIELYFSTFWRPPSLSELTLRKVLIKEVTRACWVFLIWNYGTLKSRISINFHLVISNSISLYEK